MVKKKSGHRMQKRTGPFYSLGRVKGLVNAGHYVIRAEAKDTAGKAFGWGESDMRDALMKLQPSHFYKPGISNFEPHFPIDFYKARGLKGENVYIHFYIDDETNLLMVDSFKEIWGAA
jgi:hypothetical protein